jgi:hypothetical protein
MNEKKNVGTIGRSLTIGVVERRIQTNLKEYIKKNKEDLFDEAIEEYKKDTENYHKNKGWFLALLAFVGGIAATLLVGLFVCNRQYIDKSISCGREIAILERHAELPKNKQLK